MTKPEYTLTFQFKNKEMPNATFTVDSRRKAEEIVNFMLILAEATKTPSYEVESYGLRYRQVKSC